MSINYEVPNTSEDLHYRQRLEQLSLRQWEIRHLLKFILNPPANLPANLYKAKPLHKVRRPLNDLVDDPLPQILSKVDPNKISVGGQSFGGITALMAGYANDEFKAILCLDPWTIVMPGDFIKCVTSARSVCVIMMDDFLCPLNEKRVQEVLQLNHKLSTHKDQISVQLLLPNTGHFDQSDYSLVNKSWITNMLPTPPPFHPAYQPRKSYNDFLETLILNCQLCTVFLDGLMKKKLNFRLSADISEMDEQLWRAVWDNSFIPREELIHVLFRGRTPDDL